MREHSFETSTYLTQAEFARWLGSRAPSDFNRYELLNGRLVMTSPAGWPHGQVEAGVLALLYGFVQSLQLGVVVGSSQGFELPSGDAVAADAAFISSECRASAQPLQAGEFLKLVPQLAVEVLSPSTASCDRGEKKSIYERNGVSEYWLVDPRARTVSVFHLEDGRYAPPQVIQAGDEFESRVLAGLTVDVGRLFELP